MRLWSPTRRSDSAKPHHGGVAASVHRLMVVRGAPVSSCSWRERISSFVRSIEASRCFRGHGTGTRSVLPITVVKPSNMSTKLEENNGSVRSCQRCSALCHADSRAALTFQAAIVSAK